MSYIFSIFLKTIRITLKYSGKARNLDKIVMFPDRHQSFQTFFKLSRQFRKLPDILERFQMIQELNVQNISNMSENNFDFHKNFPDTFKTVLRKF